MSRSSDEHSHSALTLLTRLAQRGKKGRDLLAGALAGRLTTLASEVLRVATETGDPIGRLFSERWENEGDAELVESLAEQCENDKYRASLPLRELALVTARQVLESRRATGPPAEIARWANAVGNRLVALGRPEEAEPFLTETVALRRQVSAVDPEAFRAVLARSLSNLGLLYLDLGRYPDALRATEEAVAIQLAAGDPETFGDQVIVRCELLAELGGHDSSP
jgi:tetratricopeptide (TPR) repeat protein